MSFSVETLTGFHSPINDRLPRHSCPLDGLVAQDHRQDPLEEGAGAQAERQRGVGPVPSYGLA